ncbi:nuclear transport factor 2 family protein [Flavobacterium sp. DG1-102-2]|uniref:YybH family protein n=1 Tax=Flavobacterium sp. DG1-102-2 TaxID=3081663 RepID=UPI00294927D4|nr:nuclear transport factor 2 family protein [Flavobacterium sp. DG1-102-2]MDV6168480.1 nuclear transport factor 2 family protein [Flavobacterium sp. DG1-102-2]
MIQSVEQMITTYVEAWNNNNLEEFRVAFAECWAENATYVDPRTDPISGVEAIANLAVYSLELSPTRKFSILTQPDHHHNVGRYTWQVHLPEGNKEGFDCFEFNEEFKITKIISFF